MELLTNDYSITEQLTKEVVYLCNTKNKAEKFLILVKNELNTRELLSGDDAIMCGKNLKTKLVIK